MSAGKDYGIQLEHDDTEARETFMSRKEISISKEELG
jgi:hypothetical protein